MDPFLLQGAAKACAQVQAANGPPELQAAAKEFMEEAMSDPGVLEERMRDMGIDLTSFGRPLNKAELLQRHAKAYRSRRETNLSYPFQLATTNMLDTKSAADFPKPPPIENCTPISCRALQLGVTHKGRVLRGVVLPEKPVVFRAVSELLEDEHGDAVQVSIYNLLPHYDSAVEAQLHAEKMFPKGRPLAIIEPYYKMMQDGSVGVRVDNPAEVVFLDKLAPSDASGWQEEGKKAYAANQPTEALHCYAEALRALGSSGSSSSSKHKKAGEPCLLASLLLNISACMLQAHHPLAALQYAAAAGATEPSASKACYRAALAIDALGVDGGSEAAEWLMFESARLAHGLEPGKAHDTTAERAVQNTAAQLLTQLRAYGGGQKEEHAQARAEQRARRLCSATDERARARAPALLLCQVCRALVGPHPCVLWEGGGDNSMQQQQQQQQQQTVQGGGTEGRCCEMGKAGGTERGGGGGKGKKKEEGGAGSRSTGSGTGVEEASRLKEQGNQLFRAREVLAAARVYSAALVQLGSQSAAVLLSNRAACFLSTGQELLAALAAAAAVLLDQSNVKAHYRLVNSLLGLEWLEEASGACTKALQLFPQEPALTGLQQRIATAAAAPAKQAGSASADTKGQQAQRQQSRAKPAAKSQRPGLMTEKEMHEMNMRKISTTQQMAFMNDMMSSMPVPAERLQSAGIDMGVDKRIPPFHQELLKAGELPALCDPEACYEHLWYGYECGRGMFVHQAVLFKFHDKDIVSPEDLLKRLQVITPANVAWLEDPGTPMGSIRFLDRPFGAQQKVYSFSNVPAHLGTPPLQPGTTHVAVGFLDLSTLCTGVAHWQDEVPQQQQQQRSHDKGSLRWVGVDSSPGCVAQALVVAEMLRGGAEVDQILQVWFSAAWSRSTLTAFRAALTSLLASHTVASEEEAWAKPHSLPAAVHRILRYWQLHDVPLAKARSLWLDNLEKTDAYVGNFVLKRDRIALCRYLVSGQLLHADVGSVTMFAYSPEDHTERSMSENFLQNLPFDEIHTNMVKLDTDPVEAGIAAMRSRITHLAHFVRQGKVDIQIHLGMVEPNNKALISHIASLQPSTLSWSNVPDYITPPRRFHALAAACSAPDTLHFMHSMNWMCCVKGACHLDYMIVDPRRSPEVLKDLFAQSKKDIQHMYKERGYNRTLLLPPVDNARNVVDYPLFHRYYKDYAQAFFSKGRHQGLLDTTKQVRTTAPVYNILSRSNTTFEACWSYSRDPSMLERLWV